MGRSKHEMVDKMSASDAAALLPYVPRLLVDWLSNEAKRTHRQITGTCMFADISGFTNLTERLAERGRAGAEEMSDVVRMVFEQLLGAAYEYGGGLIKWGGDAVIMLFDGEHHVERATRSAVEMQRVMGRIGRIATSQGTVQLRMSIGLHAGDYEFFLVGRSFRELIIIGPAVSTLVQMEKVAEATEIVLSPATAGALERTQFEVVGAAKEPGILLAGVPEVERAPHHWRSLPTVDLRTTFCQPLLEHFLSGVAESQHRHVAVSFIEMLGSDDLLASAGPSALGQAVDEFVNACQQACDHNGVTFLQSDISTNGAKAMLLAGAPTSNGDDATRMLSTVRMVIDTPMTLPARAGVTIGRAFTADYGPSYRRSYSANGDIVNLAARLCAHAAPHQIVAIPKVLEQSRTRFDAVDLPPFAAKGKSEPILAKAVGHPSKRAETRDTTPVPMVGRDDELAQLLAAADGATRRGQLAEIVGVAGIGKSRLLNELSARIPHQVLWADGDIYGRATPYGSLHRLFREQLGLPHEASPVEIGTALGELIAERAPELVPWLPLLALVAGAEVEETPEVNDTDKDNRQTKLVEVTSAALGALLDGPTLFVFNDLHYLDEATEELLRRLAHDVEDRQWLLIATRRPDYPTPFRDEQPRTVIELGPLDGLSAENCLALLTQDVPLPVHVQADLLERAGGNPLYLLELGHGVSELGSGADLPDSIEATIAARIDRLAPHQRRLLRTAAVLGMHVDDGLLRDVLAVDDPTRTVDWEGIQEFVSAAGGGEHRFTHHLVREAAYEGLPFRRRAVLHARTFDLMELRSVNREDLADLLSLHSFYGERYQAAWEYSLVAADRASKAYASADASALFQRALDASSHLGALRGEEVAGVCERLADAHDFLGEFAKAERQLTRARKLVADDPRRRAKLCLKSSMVRERLDQFPQALRWLSTGIGHLEGDTSPEAQRIRGELFARYAWVRTVQCRYADVIPWATRGIEEAHAVGDRSTEAHCLECIDWAEVGLGIMSDVPPARRALDLYVELGDLDGQGGTHNTLGARAYYLGRWAEALEHYRDAEAAWERCGASWSTSTPMASRAEILSDQGHLGAARELLEVALRLARSAKRDFDLALCNYVLGRVQARAGAFDDAHELYRAARAFYQEVGVASLEVLVDGLEAECLLAEGRADDAFTMVDGALARARRSGAMATSLPLLLRVRGLALLARDDPGAGLADLHDCLATAHGQKAVHEVAFTLEALIEHDSGASEAVQRQWRTERDALVKQLGLQRTPAAGPSPSQAEVA